MDWISTDEGCDAESVMASAPTLKIKAIIHILEAHSGRGGGTRLSLRQQGGAAARASSPRMALKQLSKQKAVKI
jgi:hypothetical protein